MKRLRRFFHFKFEPKRKKTHKALSGEISETKVAKDDLRGIEEVIGAAVMAAKEESLSLHVNVGWVIGEGGDLISEENGGGVEVLAHTVPHHSPKLLDLLLSHSRSTKKKKMNLRALLCLPL